jgi:hypothetical protein
MVLCASRWIPVSTCRHTTKAHMAALFAVWTFQAGTGPRGVMDISRIHIYSCIWTSFCVEPGCELVAVKQV